jgi:hypothetical protein
MYANKKLPKRFEPLFWEFDTDKLNIEKDKWTIIERIVNKGSFKDVRWLFEVYEQSEVQEVLVNDYNISTNAAKQWAQILNIEIKRFQCMRRPYHLRVFD